MTDSMTIDHNREHLLFWDASDPEAGAGWTLRYYTVDLEEHGELLDDLGKDESLETLAYRVRTDLGDSFALHGDMRIRISTDERDLGWAIIKTMNGRIRSGYKGSEVIAN